jgi:hypothetical protein
VPSARYQHQHQHRTASERPPSKADRATVHYGVAELDLATLEMRPFTALRATFV